MNYHRPLHIDELEANHKMVSASKFGFFLCKKGEAKVLLGTHIYDIAENYLCIYTPNTFLQVLQRSADLEGLLIEEDMDMFMSAISVVDIKKRLEIRNGPCIILNPQQSADIERYVELINEKKAEAAPDDETISLEHNRQCQFLLSALCMAVYRIYFEAVPVRSSPSGKEEIILNKFLISVYRQCHRERLVQYYAEEQNLSPYYFSTIIKSCSGNSALQWIERITLTFAKQYLECTAMSVKEIAAKMNFPDQSVFGRYFKHHEKVSPTEYRKRNHNRIFMNPFNDKL